jgi:hypothetical protein
VALTGRRRRLLLAAAIYLVATGVFFACAAPGRWQVHQSFNHYALLAASWLHGRLDLGGPAPAYTQNNDFALYQGKWFVAFPPFPAVILLPFVWAVGSPERLRDGAIWLWLAGLGPAVLFLVLEKLRRLGSERSELTNLALAATFAFGTVYFFTAVQGSVWFAAEVVGVVLTCFYLLFALDAERPVLAGLMIGLCFATRGPPIAVGGLLFVHEALRKKDRRALAWFVAPILPILALTLWHNHARFGSAFESGYRYLSIAWKARIDTWGLFSYHYLARNLGVVLTSLPYASARPPYLQVNTHGLALWVTTPIYLWLLWPRRTTGVWKPLAVVALAMAGWSLFYQNSGWQQFGYRFSDDYAPYLFALLASGGIRLGRAFWTAAALGVAVNTFGAITFERYHRFYYDDPSQKTLYQPD